MLPDLNDKKMFECKAGVPILDTHRGRFCEIDQEKLRLVVSNSNRRAQAGDPALLFIGHTKTAADAPEVEQPPLAGYVRNFQMGQHAGRPCILADFYYRKATVAQALEYPRRSVEVFWSQTVPEHNYIDAVALLKRSPERDLGLVAYAKQDRTKEFYSMGDTNASGQSLSESDIDALTGFMQRKNIRDVGDGIRAYLQAKADGTVDKTDDEFTQDDIPKLQQYMRQNGLDHGRYAEGLERYKKAKRAGTL